MDKRFLIALGVIAAGVAVGFLINEKMGVSTLIKV